MEVRNVYMNHLQQRIYYAGARDIRAVCARRFGKTDGIIGPQVKRVVDSMPQGAGIWAGNSRKQLFTRTVPATIAATISKMRLVTCTVPIASTSSFVITSRPMV